MAVLAACGARETLQEPASRQSGVPQTRRAASRPDPDLEGIRALLKLAGGQWKAGNHDATRCTIRAAWQATKSLPDAETRNEVQDLRFEIGVAAWEAGDLEAARLAWEVVKEFREHTLPDDQPDLQGHGTIWPG